MIGWHLIISIVTNRLLSAKMETLNYREVKRSLQLFFMKDSVNITKIKNRI